MMALRIFHPQFCWGALRWSALFLSCAISALILAAPDVHAQSAQPSWFPKISCRDAWKNADLARYDYDRDAQAKSGVGNVGYSSTYKKRLAKAKVDRKSCYKDWAVLVYMAADNDLSPYALWDLQEMEGRFESGRYAGSILKSDLLVQLDTDDASGVRRLHVFQRTDWPYVPAKGKDEFQGLGPEIIASPIVALEPEGPGHTLPTHAERLHAFLQWAQREYPAEKTMVILWGHGQGWTATAPDTSSSAPVPPGRLLTAGDLPSILRDLPQPPKRAAGQSFGGLLFTPQTGARVTITELRDALSDLVTRDREGRPFDVYASDACLMQMTEVAYEISPFARFIAGSAQVQSYLGLPYRRLMYEINTGRFLSSGTLTGKEDEAMLVAKMLPPLALQSYDPIHGQQGRADPAAAKNFTMSVLSTAELQYTLLPEIRKFSEAMKNYLNEKIVRSFDVALLLRESPSFMGGGKDFGAFLGLLKILLAKEAAAGGRTKGLMALETAIDRMNDALDRTIIGREFGSGYASGSSAFHLLGYRALGVWIPTSKREFVDRGSDFARASLHTQSGWLDWIKLTFGVQ